MNRCTVSQALRTAATLVRSIAIVTVAAAGCAHSPVPNVRAWTVADGNSFVVRDVRVFDGERTHEHQNVVVRAGLIASVGKASPPSDLPVINGAGRTLIPGLIDAHAHVESETNLRDALRFGITTELDMLSRVDFDRTQKPRRSRIERTDLADLFFAGSPITSPGGLGSQFGIPFTTITKPEDAAEIVSSRIRDGSDYIKVLYEPGAPLFTTISKETLRAVIAAAHAQGVLITAHVSSLEGARDAVRSGVDGLAHTPSDSVMDAALVKEIASRHVFVSPTLSIFGAFQGRSGGAELLADPRLAPFLTAAQKKELVQVGPGKDHPMAPYLVRFDIDRAKDNVRRMRAAGVSILAGTDAANLTSHGVSVHGEMKLLTDAGLTPAEALRAATRGPADAFHLADRGRIAGGARADLVLIEGNPLEDITMTRAIVTVFKNGFAVSRAVPAP